METSKKLRASLGLSLLMTFSNATAHHSCASKPEFAHIKEQMPTIFNALLYRESGNHQFNKDGTPKKSISKVPAWGAAQMQIPTGEDMSRIYKIPCDAKDILHDGKKNRACGKVYLTHLWKNHGCNVQMALAAYNWGQGNLKKAIKKAEDNGLGTDGWFKFAPKETKKYISDILNDVTKATAQTLAPPVIKKPEPVVTFAENIVN